MAMTPEHKQRLAQLMKERWADPVQRKILLKGVRKGGKKGRATMLLARKRAGKKTKTSRPPSARTLRALASGGKPAKPTSINVGELRERWSSLIIQELHAHIVTQIGDAASLAGIKPRDLTKRLIRQLQK